MKIAGGSEREHGDRSTQAAVLAVCHTLRAGTGWVGKWSTLVLGK